MTEPHCLRDKCRSQDVDVTENPDGSVHIYCNECQWLHRNVHPGAFKEVPS